MASQGVSMSCYHCSDILLQKKHPILSFLKVNIFKTSLLVTFYFFLAGFGLEKILPDICPLNFIVQDEEY